MQKIAVVVSLLLFTSLAQGGDTFKLLLSDIHAEAIISYLEAADIESAKANPFAEFQRSDKLIATLASYAALMDETIAQQRDTIWSAVAQPASPSAKRDFEGLRAAKIRHQIAVTAIQQLEPGFVVTAPPLNAGLVAGRGPDGGLIVGLMAKAP